VIGSILPKLGFLCLSLLQLCRGTRQTDRQTDRQRSIYNAPYRAGRPGIIILQYTHLEKHVFNVSTILINDTVQTTFPLSDAVINEAPWQCAPLQHECTIDCFNTDQRCRTSCRGRLSPALPPNDVIHPIYIRVFGAHVRLNADNISRRRYAIVSRSVQSSVVALSNVLRFH